MLTCRQRYERYYEAFKDKMQNREGDLQFGEHEIFLLLIISDQRLLISQELNRL